MKEDEPYRGHYTLDEVERELAKSYGYQTEELRRYAEMGRGQKGVALIMRRPQILPMSAVVKMSGHFVIAKGATVKDLEEWIRARQKLITKVCLLWLLERVNEL